MNGLLHDTERLAVETWALESRGLGLDLPESFALATAGSDEAGILDWLNVSACGDEVARGEPSSEVYLLAAQARRRPTSFHRQRGGEKSLLVPDLAPLGPEDFAFAERCFPTIREVMAYIRDIWATPLCRCLEAGGGNSLDIPDSAELSGNQLRMDLEGILGIASRDKHGRLTSACHRKKIGIREGAAYFS